MRTAMSNKRSKGNKDGHVRPIVPRCLLYWPWPQTEPGPPRDGRKSPRKRSASERTLLLSESKLDNDVRSKFDDDSTITDALRSAAG
ncbi:hypothetical protein Trydic_g2423 [Trypoxylus dichotomus]